MEQNTSPVMGKTDDSIPSMTYWFVTVESPDGVRFNTVLESDYPIFVQSDVDYAARKKLDLWQDSFVVLFCMPITKEQFEICDPHTA